MNRIKYILYITEGFRWSIALFMLLDIISSLLLLYFVYCSKQAIDIVLQVIPGNLKMMLIVILLSLTASVLLNVISLWISEYTKNKMIVRLQNDLAHSQIWVPWKTINQFFSGDLMVRFQSDCVEVVHTLVYTIPSIILTGFKLLAAFTLLWSLDSELAKLIIILSPLFALSKVYFRRIRRLTREIKVKESHLGNLLQENMEYRSLIQGLSITEVKEKKYADGQHSLLRIKIQHLNLSVLRQVLLKLILNGGYLLTFLWGLFRLKSGVISYGTMAAFLQLIGRIQVPVLSLMSIFTSIIRFRVAIERLLEISEGEHADRINRIKLTLPLTLKLDHISYKYNEKEVISDFSVECRTGVPTAITGASGKGKTTLLRLILAMVKPDRGNITVIQENDGVHHTLSEHTRHNIAYVPQGNTMFIGTIRENLIVSNPEASDEQIKDAIEKSMAEFVYLLPNGIDTVIGELGIGISEGQAQRLAVARALLQKDTSIWVLDEPTSAMDSDMNNAIIDNILREGKDKVLIFVTHDRYVIEKCQNITRLS
ncbi:MAG: ABC transporter ATP-binding protein/permease [Tannerella sp.]|nr:ABC transporter ATP-binding protein/permease [Tannerella sp.]